MNKQSIAMPHVSSDLLGHVPKRLVELVRLGHGVEPETFQAIPFETMLRRQTSSIDSRPFQHARCTSGSCAKMLFTKRL